MITNLTAVEVGFKMIDYYGEDANYIHTKFGDLRKMYNFTPAFKELYPKFAEEYTKYWNGEIQRI